MSTTKLFQRKIEDFVCENCGNEVKGTGYTNHCPKCLWSKHVDIHPGDRAETCLGMMRPIGSEMKAGDTYILYICSKCGASRRKRLEKDDNVDVLVDLARKRAGN